MRSASVGALLALGVAAAAVTPTWVLIALATLTALARTVDRSMTSLILRRHERGQRSSDVPVLAAIAPWHLVLGTLTALASLIVPLLVAAAAVFTTSLVLTAVTGEGAPNGLLPLAVGGLFGLVMVWWGPGGASVRRGTRSIIRGATPGQASQTVLIAVVLLTAVGLVLWGVLAQGGVPMWSPAGDPATWSLFGL